MPRFFSQGDRGNSWGDPGDLQGTPSIDPCSIIVSHFIFPRSIVDYYTVLREARKSATRICPVLLQHKAFRYLSATTRASVKMGGMDSRLEHRDSSALPIHTLSQQRCVKTSSILNLTVQNRNQAPSQAVPVDGLRSSTSPLRPFSLHLQYYFL